MVFSFHRVFACDVLYYVAFVCFVSLVLFSRVLDSKQTIW